MNFGYELNRIIPFGHCAEGCRSISSPRPRSPLLNSVIRDIKAEIAEYYPEQNLVLRKLSNVTPPISSLNLHFSGDFVG
jgi:hypothetical protein